MIADWIASLFLAFVVDPLQVEIEDRLAEMKAPVEVVTQAGDCLRSTGTTLVQRASGDLWWAGTTAVSVVTGLTSPAELLDAGNPACGAVATYLALSVIES
jgi:hypothetical protein